jgi:hypothetical protein
LYPPSRKDEEAGARPELLPPFSKHRGLWRVFGYGMYVLSGPDVKRFNFNENFQGWGHEDKDFYKLVHNQLRVDRKHEHGLIHKWHPKDCSVGKEVITEQQWTDCLNSRDIMEGSALGMLLRPPLPDRNAEEFAAAMKEAEERIKAAKEDSEQEIGEPDVEAEAEDGTPEEAQERVETTSKDEREMNKGGDSEITDANQKKSNLLSFVNKYEDYKQVKAKAGEHQLKQGSELAQAIFS